MALGVNPGIVYIVLANVIGATSYLGMKKALEGMPPALTLLLRVVVCLVVLAPFLWREKQRGELGKGFDRADVRAIALMSLIGLGAAIYLSMWGIHFSSATNGALFIGVEPVFILLLSVAFLREKLTAWTLGAFGAALCGATVIASDGIPFVTAVYSEHLWGDLLLIAAGLCFAVYSVVGKRVLTRHSSLQVTALINGFAGIAFLILTPFELRHFPLRAETFWPAMLWVVYLGVFVSLLSYYWWNRAMKTLDATQIAVYVNIQPLVGALLGWFVLHEEITRFTIAGGVLITIGVWLSVEGEKRAATARAVAERAERFT